MPRELTSEQILAVVRDEAAQAAVRGGQATQAAIRRLMPVRTGHARRSLSVSSSVTGSQISVRVNSPLSYVRYLDEGTGLYGPKHEKITPKARQALAFIGSTTGSGRPSFGNPNAPFTLAGRLSNRAVSGKGVTPGLADALGALVVVRSVKGVHPMHFIERGVVQARDLRHAELRLAGPRIHERLAELIRE